MIVLLGDQGGDLSLTYVLDKVLKYMYKGYKSDYFKWTVY